MVNRVSAYHFINIDQFNVSDSLSYIKKLNESEAIVCFDLEDSIPGDYAAMHKENIIAIIILLLAESDKIHLGIRINNPNSKNYNNDIDFLNSFNKYFNIEAIFIPKINDLGDIIFAADTLKKSNVNYNHLIPIIETKSGMRNINEIGRASNKLFNKIAFGHADYNFDMRNFPFYHQNSDTYWNWIACILGAIEPHGKSIINSPLLFLDDNNLFVQMLNKLNSICRNKCGQITLTVNQTKLCRTFNNSTDFSSQIFNFENNRNAQYIIDNYIKYKINNQLIAIEPEERYLISPQEFNAAKNYVSKMHGLKIMITGGCFTEQHNITYPEHYHQLLKAKLKNDNFDVHIDIVRYERLTKCLQKIISQTKIQQPDILVFHVRSEPLLRIAKFYYKFLDTNKKIKYAFNFSLFNKNNSESHRHFINRPKVFTNSIDNQKENAFYLFLLNFNYLFGALFGNWKFAYKLYLKLIHDIQKFCTEKRIPLIIVGPVSRPRNYLENLLSIKLNNYFEVMNFNQRESYIKTLGIYDKKKGKLFFENGMHVNQFGHKRIADFLYKVILDKYIN